MSTAIDKAMLSSRDLDGRDQVVAAGNIGACWALRMPRSLRRLRLPNRSKPWHRRCRQPPFYNDDPATATSVVGVLCRAESRLAEYKRAHNFCRDLVAKKPRRGLKIVRVIWSDGRE
jgi:hypothetical protein